MAFEKFERAKLFVLFVLVNLNCVNTLYHTIYVSKENKFHYLEIRKAPTILIKNIA